MAPLPEPTADTRALVGFAVKLLESIFRPGYAYQKAGVMLTELQPLAQRQGTLFGVGSEVEMERSAALMSAMDQINARWGRGSVRVSAEGVERAWQMRRGHLSPAYTTSWEDLPPVKA
jgi:DNA polymerase V